MKKLTIFVTVVALLAYVAGATALTAVTTGAATRMAVLQALDKE